ncbi:MAG: hypothetical protein CM1200mP41_29500 [Gammaproteobacteria bacterium]|nr:MAG: hypothetical protein CM1200mP41_29500 [Gammaproteobacteria bacterium]
MVSVEADVVAGPLLAREAAAAGVVYSLAWGDQPALVCEHVDWARACGFEVVCAGKGTRYHPDYHQLTPDTVWDVLRQYLDIQDPQSINLKMFNSFLDGSKSGIEMTAVCNATGLTPQPNGLGFPPSSRFDLANTCKPPRTAVSSSDAAPLKLSRHSTVMAQTCHTILPWALTLLLPAKPITPGAAWGNITCCPTHRVVMARFTVPPT